MRVEEALQMTSNKTFPFKHLRGFIIFTFILLYNGLGFPKTYTMRLENIKAILFDFDGTLVDTYQLYVESYTRTLMDHFQKRLSLKEIAKLKPRAELEFIPSVVGDEKSQEYLERFYQFYSELHGEFFEGVYPGCKDVLKAIRTRGFSTGIITGKSRRAYEITMSHIDLEHFDTSITHTEVEQLKPSPQPLLVASDNISMNPKNCLYIGDSPVDYEAALQAGMVFGGVLWSKNERETNFFLSKVEEGERVFLLKHPKDILDLTD